MLVVLAEARFDASQMDKVRAVARPMPRAPSRAAPATTMPSTYSSPT
jgi:hypothetical protein